MPDPSRRLRRLDEIPERDLWGRIRAQADGSGPLQPIPESRSLGRRVITIGVAFAVFASGGAFLLSGFDDTRVAPRPSHVTPADDPPADEEGGSAGDLVITCGQEGTTVAGDQVVLRPDGVHVSVRNGTDSALLLIRDPKDHERSGGFELIPGSNARVLSFLEPGTYVAGCFSERSFDIRDVPLSAYSAPFRIVDPHGYLDGLHDAAGCGEPLPQAVPTAGTDAVLSAPLTGRMTVQAWNHDTGEGRAFLVYADGSDVNEIEVAGHSIDDVVLSPDGSRIVVEIHGDSDGDPHTYYASKDDGELYVANVDGSDLVQLTKNQAEDYLPAWTPDGRISFTSNRDGGITIYSMSGDGSDVRRLVDLEIADKHDWSSDGRLAFIGSDGRDRGDGCRGNNNDLYEMGPEGSDIIPLTDDELWQQSPAWSPDGSTIAFIVSNQSDYAWEIFLMSADGSDVRRITDYDGYDSSPVWSPDGALIAFTSDRFRGVDIDGESQGGLPYVMNADGSGVQSLLTPEDLGLSGDWEIYITDWRA